MRPEVSDRPLYSAVRSYQPRDRRTMRTTEGITATSIRTPTAVARAAPDPAAPGSISGGCPHAPRYGPPRRRRKRACAYFLSAGGGAAGLLDAAGNGEREAAAGFGLSFLGFFGSRPLRF